MMVDGKVTKGEKEWTWQVVSEPEPKEKEQLIKTYGIEREFSIHENEKEISYFQRLDTEEQGTRLTLHLPFWVNGKYGSLDVAENSITLIVSEKNITCLVSPVYLDKTLTDLEACETPYSLAVRVIEEEYKDVKRELDRLKADIESVEVEAKGRTDQEILMKLTGLEQELVIFTSRLDHQEETIKRYMEDKSVGQHTDENEREDIRIALMKTHFAVHMYEELVDSTSGLLSDSIDNKLNNIMEYLESASLIIAIPTLIFSLFGMNTGGLVGKDSPFGTGVVILVSVLMGIGTALYLKKKDFY